MRQHISKQRCAIMNSDDLPKPKHEHVLGENLDAISVDELNLRVSILKLEIERIEAEIVRKQASRTAADAFFKS
jgi:uncharacterized small protein (DUF1192 family)